MFKLARPRLLTFFTAILISALFSATGLADETEDAIVAKLSAAVPQLDITGIKESEVPGLYKVASSNSGTVLVTEDGQYLLTGDLLKITPQGIANLSEQKRLTERSDVLKAFGTDGVIA